MRFGNIPGDFNGEGKPERKPQSLSPTPSLTVPEDSYLAKQEGPLRPTRKSYPLNEKIKRLGPQENKWTPQGHTVSLEEMRKNRKMLQISMGKCR